MTERVAASSLLAQHVGRHPSVSLEQVLSVAELTTRDDVKYVIPVDTLPTLLPRVPLQLAALDIGGLRTFDYESVYFDTERLDLYRDHLQDRRRRYKVRIRSYRDSGDAMLEVKLKGRRGQTVKHRLDHDFSRRAELTHEGRAFLDSVVSAAYGFTPPALRPVLTTAYRRATLVDLERSARVTIDVALSWFDGESSHCAEHVVLIETKSLSGAGPVDALLRSMGHRPLRVSKYCMGVALLHPETAANRWNRPLTRHFQWRRLPEAERAPR